MNETLYGVFPHAEWQVSNPETNDGQAVPTGRGFVVRTISNAVPYARMTPVRTFKRKSAADKLSDKLTFGDSK